MTTKALVYPVFFIILALIMLVLVPRRKITELLPFGLIGGMGLAMLVQVIAVLQLGLWRWRYTVPFGWSGMPLFISAAWIPVEIIFAHYIHENPKEMAPLYVLGFAGIATAVEWWFIRGGYQVHIRWSLLSTFVLSLAIHSLLALYVLAVEPRQSV